MAYMILVQVNDLSAGAYSFVMDNFKIVQYEIKSNSETIENIYYAVNILKILFLVFCGDVIYSATNSGVQSNSYCGELVFNAPSRCFACMCMCA